MNLFPHEQGQACDETPTPMTYPRDCYSYSAMPGKDGLVLFGSRATTMDLIANFIGTAPGASDEVARRVVDQTGLTGLWDFTLSAGAWPKQTPAPPPDETSTGPTLLQGLQDQLGIKLKPARAVVSVLVIDDVQRPGGN